MIAYVLFDDILGAFLAA